MDYFQKISQKILEHFPNVTPESLTWSPTPKPELGDVAFRMFEAARTLNCPPHVLAARVVEEVRFGKEVIKATAAGPYVNFVLDKSLIGRQIVDTILTAGIRYGSHQSGIGKKALVEHTSINPNASPHVGRARNAMIGDSLVRLLRFEGYEVEVHYYVNDMGRQIGLLVLGIEEHVGPLTNGLPPAIPFEKVLQVYVEANARAEHDSEFAAQGYDLLAQMEQGNPDVQRRFRAVTDLCLKGQLAVLARLGITYDVFDHESDYIRDPHLDEIIAALKEKGAIFTDEEGRLVADLSHIGYPYEEGRYFVLKRANGSSMYGYRDLAYTIHKMNRGAQVNIIVLGEDHKMYAQQQAAILQAAGYPAPEAVYYSYIILKEGKMSTRQGKVVLLSDFLDEATQRALEKVRQEWTDLSEEQCSAIATKIAVGAVRFAILKVNPNKNVVFDWESSLSFTGDTGPYIQYSCARIASILRKFGNLPDSVGDDFVLETAPEWALCLKLAVFPDIVRSAVEQRSPAPVAQYALETARLFTTFYHECPVLEAPSAAQKISRAQLCAATRTVISNALSLLGIESMERM
ncbi:MAG TPA: arginine--tRNA ligase [Candidatus Hydrogenedentes bacterium]|nr:arginine--tRNA ligase [Candidatus Hydrogenedentota bacterium]HOL75811.1 arginine--tRNA ligase [Candidatus Hydrogenedentota bacterium]HPO87184.1 arginine--tRNA ligase [Candidatus Hydrogenedentota bacterium]